MSASKVEFCGFLIVDDADLLCNVPDNETTWEEMLPQFQAMVDCWEENLRVTGGGINPDKSFGICWIIAGILLLAMALFDKDGSTSSGFHQRTKLGGESGTATTGAT